MREDGCKSVKWTSEIHTGRLKKKKEQKRKKRWLNTSAPFKKKKKKFLKSIEAD